MSELEFYGVLGDWEDYRTPSPIEEDVVEPTTV